MLSRRRSVLYIQAVSQGPMVVVLLPAVHGAWSGGELIVVTEEHRARIGRPGGTHMMLSAVYAENGQRGSGESMVAFRRKILSSFVIQWGFYGGVRLKPALEVFTYASHCERGDARNLSESASYSSNTRHCHLASGPEFQRKDDNVFGDSRRNREAYS